MSGTRFYRSWRGRLPLLATFVVLMGMVFAAPGAAAPPSRNVVKQFTASIYPGTALGQTAGSWTETIQNCGPASAPPCDGTHPSTINLGTFQIAVPAEFRPITSVTRSFPSGQPTRNWTVSYSAGTINGFANGGTDKLMPGESIMITFGATPSTCTGAGTFTTAAWGSTPTPGSDPFEIKTSQPTITISGCHLSPGGQVEGPNHTIVTAGDEWTGTVDVTFGGTLTCNDDPQWQQGYHLPDVVNIDPSGVTSDTVKSFTFTFSGDADSSFYRICYTPSELATTTTGFILPPCYSGSGAALEDPPCVAKQFRVFNTSTVSIKIRVPAGDPRAH
jgi:hypothetical protein